MKHIINTIRERWKAQMPVFFRWIMGIGTGIATVSFSIQMALDSSGASAPEWWVTIYPYLIGIGAGMTATAKFTQKQ